MTTDVVRVEPDKFSRLLYPNPVCLLTTNPNDENEHPNAMVSSWLTPINNKVGHITPSDAPVTTPIPQGVFVFSLNKRRHTATRLEVLRRSEPPSHCCPCKVGVLFGLSVPAEDMSAVVLKIGTFSGHGQNDKLGRLGVKLCRSGWIALDREK